MPITQIPFQDPVAPPEKSQPEQLDLYTTREWETAYRELDDRVPHLIIQLQDDLSRSRRREAAWISIIVHLVVFIMLWQAKLIGKYIPWHRAMAVPVDLNKDKNMTFLALPSDLQKVPHKPNTNIASDKDRIAMSRHPQLDTKELRKILATPPPGAPGPTGPRVPQAPPQEQAQAPAPQQGEQAQRPQFENNQTAQLQLPPRPNPKSVFNKYATGMTAGSAIQQATQAAAASRGAGGGQEGDFGLGTGAKGARMGPFEILSDTQGVDFGPYLQRILIAVRDNWYREIPLSAEMKKGKLQIEFAITKDGDIADMKVTNSSNDTALDRAAWGGIMDSKPFPPLPSEFTGPYLSLRFRFYYNPDKADLE